VSCGYFDGQQVAIICPQTGRTLAEDQVGEICVQGGSVAQGYWGNLQATEEAFTQSEDDKSVWLKTGDLGFINQGELFVTGRLKDLILINGRNIYPQDIEFHIKACDANFGKCFGAAFSVAAEHSEEIVLIQEVDNQVRDEQVLAQLCEKIRDELSRTFNAPVHEIVLIKRGTIDRTTSGKIQRKKNAQQWRDGTLTVLHRWSAHSYLNQVA
jgi:acyl-CoA synthetase (AMP-forming)/AMP-acid ligase II